MVAGMPQSRMSRCEDGGVNLPHPLNCSSSSLRRASTSACTSTVPLLRSGRGRYPRFWMRKMVRARYPTFIQYVAIFSLYVIVCVWCLEERGMSLYQGWEEVEGRLTKDEMRAWRSTYWTVSFQRASLSINRCKVRRAPSPSSISHSYFFEESNDFSITK